MIYKMHYVQNLIRFMRCILFMCCVHFFINNIHLKYAINAFSTEYLDEREEFTYDLDTEQSLAKYDAHMLSEQMLSSEQQPQQTRMNADSEEDDLEPHGLAASCHSNGRKYTHGQKVPRIDPCEICICMDGEIFCWWEMCDKFVPQSSTPNYSDLYHGTKVNTVYKKSSVATEQSNNKPKDYVKDYDYRYQSKLVNFKNDFSGNQNLNKQQTKSKEQHVSHHKQLKQHEPQEHRQQKEHQQLLQNQQHHAMQQKHLCEQQQHSKSKIMNFPENLPSLLYYDYKTEEHEHHQHQHHQQHIMHQQQQQQQLQQQQLNKHNTLTTFTATSISLPTKLALTKSNNNVDTDVNKNSDDAEIDSDILPEPPTKKPKLTTSTTKKLPITLTSVASKTLISNSIGLKNDKIKPAKDVTDLYQQLQTYKEDKDNKDNNNNNNNDNEHDENDLDDAFHRWLTSTELIVDEFGSDNKSMLSYNLTPQATTTTTTTSQFAAATIVVNTSTATTTAAAAAGHDTKPTRRVVATVTTVAASGELRTNNTVNVNENISETDKKHANSNSIDDNADIKNDDITAQDNNDDNIRSRRDKKNENENKSGKYAIIRSTETDYSNEVNGSVVKIDISLTTVDEQQQQQHQQKQQQQQLQQLPQSIDLIVNKNWRTNQTQSTINNTSKKMPPTNAHLHPSRNVADLTSIATADPRQKCNVMGKLYNIGDILPRVTGNCLQCVCSIDGSSSDETPRVTCSPHNCPPLVLPDLLDATGY